MTKILHSLRMSARVEQDEAFFELGNSRDLIFCHIRKSKSYFTCYWHHTEILVTASRNERPEVAKPSIHYIVLPDSVLFIKRSLISVFVILFIFIAVRSSLMSTLFKAQRILLLYSKSSWKL